MAVANRVIVPAATSFPTGEGLFVADAAEATGVPGFGQGDTRNATRGLVNCFASLAGVAGQPDPLADFAENTIREFVELYQKQ